MSSAAREGSMGNALGTVPALYWIAAVWLGLAAWADDVRGAYIAVVCLVLGTVQLFRTNG